MLLGVLLPFESISEYDNKQWITIKYQIEKCQDSYFLRSFSSLSMWSTFP